MRDWLIKYLSPILCTGIVTGVIAAYRKKCKKQHALENGMVALLRSELYKIYFDCEKQGFVTVEQLENAENIYTPYHDGGHNSTGTCIYERIKNMPHKEKGERV